MASVQTLSLIARSIFLHPGFPPTCVATFFHLSQFAWKACFTRTWRPEPGETRHSSASCVSVNRSHITIGLSSIPAPLAPPAFSGRIPKESAFSTAQLCSAGIMQSSFSNISIQRPPPTPSSEPCFGSTSTPQARALHTKASLPGCVNFWPDLKPF